MYSDKLSVALLCQLMMSHGVHHVVVCPGSRNAPLVHNFYELSQRGCLHVYPVTDERSAAFVAIGLYLATRQPAAVCVTSGTALFNTLPAVAEAYYRHAPLLVISADRPEQDLDCLRGQTLPQQGALMPYCRTWQIPESDAPFATRLLNEALLSLHHDGGKPAHINLPLTPPLNTYDMESLPTCRVVREERIARPNPIPEALMQEIARAKLPALVVGYLDFPPEDLLQRLVEERRIAVISDRLSSSQDQIVGTSSDFSPYPIPPDVVVHIGGTSLDRSFRALATYDETTKTFTAIAKTVIRIEESDTAMPDTFGGLTHVVRATPEEALRQLLSLPPNDLVRQLYDQDINSALKESDGLLSRSKKEEHWLNERYELTNFLASLWNKDDLILHVGNSMSARLISHLRYHIKLENPLQPLPIFCNRGVNGIEGSLSVAAGHSLATDKMVLCMLGDLSFFYDSNALWNSRLRGNLRVLILNDQGGGIFDNLYDNRKTPAKPLIAGHHNATARGVCESYGCTYKAVLLKGNKDEEYSELYGLLDPNLPLTRPLVVELFYQEP